MAKKLTNQQIIEVALNMPWSVNPTSDLVKAIRQEFNISDNQAGNLVDRILNKGLIKQVYSNQKIYNPIQAGNINSDPFWAMSGAKWEVNNDQE